VATDSRHVRLVQSPWNTTISLPLFIQRTSCITRSSCWNPKASLLSARMKSGMVHLHHRRNLPSLFHKNSMSSMAHEPVPVRLVWAIFRRDVPCWSDMRSKTKTEGSGDVGELVKSHVSVGQQLEW